MALIVLCFIWFFIFSIKSNPEINNYEKSRLTSLIIFRHTAVWKNIASRYPEVSQVFTGTILDYLMSLCFRLQLRLLNHAAIFGFSREAYYWLWQNTKPDSRIMSWWDYGYQIAGMANRTTLVDNNTWNNSHIALVGKAMASNESEAYKVNRFCLFLWLASP